ncbi:MAG: DUF4230 domain-containing protein [Clostridia bacterium]|nr:DUF4230 domain-containing protein [Clostridia bacterium]
MNIKDVFKSKKISAIAVSAVMMIIAAVCVLLSSPDSAEFASKTSLKKVLDSADFSTAEYTYNSIATVMEKENVKYYVAYEGTVKAGFDFEKIDVTEKDKKITITIPEVDIISVDVDENMEYMFTKKKYEKENTYQEAYSACVKDLKEKAKNNETLNKTAEDSAIETVKALIKPWEKKLKKGYSVEIKTAGN